jgi:hypothetical protein
MTIVLDLGSPSASSARATEKTKNAELALGDPRMSILYRSKGWDGTAGGTFLTLTFLARYSQLPIISRIVCQPTPWRRLKMTCVPSSVIAATPRGAENWRSGSMPGMAHVCSMIRELPHVFWAIGRTSRESDTT